MRVFGSDLGVVEGLIAINVLVFILTLTQPQAIISNFGLKAGEVLERPWIMVTSMFLHGGFYHLFANMMTLFFFGLYLVSLVGEEDFLKIYFMGGLAGGLLFVVLSPGNALAVGASGAVFAVGGALAVMRPHLKVIIFPLPIPISLWVAVIGGFFLMALLPQVAWQGHLGGMIVGLLYGQRHKGRERKFRENYGYRF